MFFDNKEFIYFLVFLLNWWIFFWINGFFLVDIDVICCIWLFLDIIEIDMLTMLDKNSKDLGILFINEENYFCNVLLVKLVFVLIFDCFDIFGVFSGNLNYVFVFLGIFFVR